MSHNILSSDGEYLAVYQRALNKINIINTTSGESVIQIDRDPNYYNATFSDDGHWFVNSDKTTINVWDLRRRCRHLTYDLKQLEQGNVRAKTETKTLNDFMSSRTSLSVSKDGRYLAFWRELILTVFDVSTMKIVGQAECQECPQFLADGTIAVFQGYEYPLNPLKSAFVVENNSLKRVVENTETKKVKAAEHNESYLTQNQSTFITYQRSLNVFRSPDWIPTSIKSVLDEWLSKLKKSGLFTLRELITGKELAHITMQVDRRHFTGYISFDPPPPLLVFISPDRGWLVRQEKDSIELWPLLTYWRPWYCWVTVAGLVLIAVYCVWYCRRSAIGR